MTKEELKVFQGLLKQMNALVGRSLKRINAKEATAKAIANGSTIGRPKIRNDERIKKLREKGFTIRQIASMEGVSTGAVQKGMRS